MFDMPCVILAGGKSSRMEEDKCFLSFKDTTLIKYQYDRLKQIFPKVYISSKTNKFDFECNLILDNNKEYSPLLAINEIINKLKNDKFFLITVDTPNISKNSIEKIINSSFNIEITIFQTKDNKTHNLCGVFSKDIQIHITNLIKNNNHKILNLIEISKSKKILIDDNDEFINLNTKTDYERFIKLL